MLYGTVPTRLQTAELRGRCVFQLDYDAAVALVSDPVAYGIVRTRVALTPYNAIRRAIRQADASAGSS